MAAEVLAETEQIEEEVPAKKGKKKFLLLLVVVILLLGGGGGGFYLWKVKARAKQASSNEKAKPGEKTAGTSDEAEVSEIIELQPFIVNLADKNDARYLRMTISLGVSGEEKAGPLFTTKVRNAILSVVTTKTSDEVLTVEGKIELRKEILEVARKAVDKPQVHAIYITDFIIQM